MMQDDARRINLKPDCEKCFGLCCVALYFSTHDGFPTNKKAGTPCPNLDIDFRCKVHAKLTKLGLKGCIGYECFGAGQQVSQNSFSGQDWRQNPPSANLMFEVFSIMRQLHELCWYLRDALLLKIAASMQKEIETALQETEQITQLAPQLLKEFDITAHCEKVSILLASVSGLVRNDTNHKSQQSKDLFGKDLRKMNLRNANLRGSCLIAANLEGMDLSGADFIGADLRDTNIRGADLSKSIFLTQFQINVARGNAKTKLPQGLSRPFSWSY